MAHHPGGVSTGVNLHFRAKGARDPQDSGALVTWTHTSRSHCDGDFAL
jgi:hypothetical protein